MMVMITQQHKHKKHGDAHGGDNGGSVTPTKQHQGKNGHTNIETVFFSTYIYGD